MMCVVGMNEVEKNRIIEKWNYLVVFMELLVR